MLLNDMHEMAQKKQNLTILLRRQYKICDLNNILRFYAFSVPNFKVHAFFVLHFPNIYLYTKLTNPKPNRIKLYKTKLK